MPLKTSLGIPTLANISISAFGTLSVSIASNATASGIFWHNLLELVCIDSPNLAMALLIQSNPLHFYEREFRAKACFPGGGFASFPFGIVHGHTSHYY